MSTTPPTDSILPLEGVIAAFRHLQHNSGHALRTYFSSAIHHLEAGKGALYALQFIRDECNWEENKGDGNGGDDRIGPACDKALSHTEQEGQQR
jgi:hypothetical protein